MFVNAMQGVSLVPRGNRSAAPYALASGPDGEKTGPRGFRGFVRLQLRTTTSTPKRSGDFGERLILNHVGLGQNCAATLFWIARPDGARPAISPILVRRPIGRTPAERRASSPLKSTPRPAASSNGAEPSLPACSCYDTSQRPFGWECRA